MTQLRQGFAGQDAPGIAATPPSRAEFIERIKGLWHRSREQILSLGRALIDAKQTLAHGDFAAMIREDLPFGPRMAQHLMAIARDERLNAKTSSYLPAAAGALVELRKLHDEAFEAAVENGRIHPGLTVKNARELVQVMLGQRDAHGDLNHRPRAVAGQAPVEPSGGVARNYAELVWLLRARRHALGITHLELDERAGFEDGYASKLEQPVALYGRSAVNPSFDLWLGGLGVGLTLTPLK